MKVLPSIAFGEFTGSAGDVTARSIGGRTILNHKAYQAKTKTPSQAVSRNTLSKVSRAYKQLTDSQMKAWGALAEHLKGISTFGKAAEMTAHNAFVRINANRQLVDMPLFTDAPDYTDDVPEPDWMDFWVTPERLIFIGVEHPKDSYCLVVKMGPAQSPGVSSGWGNVVIITPDMVPDWGDVDLLEVYTDRFGLIPVLGQKYFIEMYWLDSETGFVGETMRVKAVCNTLSQVEHIPYVERPAITDKIIRNREELTSVDIEFTEGQAILSYDIQLGEETGGSFFSTRLESFPDSLAVGHVYVLGRNPNDRQSDRAYAPRSYYMYLSHDVPEGMLEFSQRGGIGRDGVEIFGSGVQVSR